jgi:hypothetical protein
MWLSTNSSHARRRGSSASAYIHKPAGIRSSTVRRLIGVPTRVRASDEVKDSFTSTASRAIVVMNGALSAV